MDEELGKLAFVLRTFGLVRGEFVLPDGSRTDVMVDVVPSVLHPLGSVLLGRCLHARASEKFPRAVGVIGGTSSSRLLLGPVVSASSESSRHPSFGGTLEIKVGGNEVRLGGELRMTDRVVLLESVTGSGAFTVAQVEALRGLGFDVQGVLAVVDRREGARAALRGVTKFESLLSMSQVERAKLRSPKGGTK